MSESLDLEHTFNHPFREVISAWIRKDSHPSQENVSSHILERYVDESGKRGEDLRENLGFVWFRCVL